MATERISSAERQRLEAEYPELPKTYFDHLETIGWGDTPNGRILYSGPVPATDIYEGREGLDTILLIGDDMQGYCVGFDTRTQQAVEVDIYAVAEPIDQGFLADY